MESERSDDVFPRELIMPDGIVEIVFHYGKSHVPITKAEDHEAFLDLSGQRFIWRKKSAKRQDVAANSAALNAGLAEASRVAR